MMRASVLVGDEPFAQPEDADLQFAHCNDAVVAIGQFAAAADHDLSHSLRSNHGRLTGRPNHIAISNGFSSAARIIAQTATAVSVAVTSSGLERCDSPSAASAFAA